MKMSDGVEWGLHCATLLASLPDGATLPSKALAEAHGVSESYLLKHLRALAAAGVLASVPGPKGGYRLAKAPAEITLLDVVEAIDGSAPAFRCAEIRRRGPMALEDAAYRTPCAINAAMLKAERAYRDALRAETPQSVLHSYACVADPRAIERAAHWIDANARR